MTGVRISTEITSVESPTLSTIRWLGRLGVLVVATAAALMLGAVGLTVLAPTPTSLAKPVLGFLVVGLTGTFRVLILRRATRSGCSSP